ncbi:MAG: hypothetical protein IPM36_20925 [Lewinellaceae bacterium]|nr:hypothetical protein [Lewinellaceae bacterium]
MPALKRFLSEVRQGIIPQTYGSIRMLSTLKRQKELLKYVKFQHNENVLNSVKPTRLIKRMLEIGVDPSNEEIVLDFFSGSAPTAHAIIQKNIEAHGNVKFICIQIPEPLPKPEPQLGSIFEMGLTRVKNVVQESKLKITVNNTDVDSGFKILRLTPSHFKPWQNYHGQDPAELETLFSQFEDPLQEGWTEAGLTTEILLTEGFPLDSRIRAEPAYGANRVRRVRSDFHAYSLLVCLYDKSAPHTIARLDLGSNDVFICLDRAITDQEKLRLSDKGLLKTI